MYIKGKISTSKGVRCSESRTGLFHESREIEIMMRSAKKTVNRSNKYKPMKQLARKTRTSQKRNSFYEMIKKHSNKILKKKLTLRKKSKRMMRKVGGEQSIDGKLQSMEKLLTCFRKNFDSNKVLDHLYRWSLRSTYKAFIRHNNDLRERQIQPVAIVPPLPFPVWARGPGEDPQYVTLRRSVSLCNTKDGESFKSKLVLRERSRRHRMMIPTEALARVLAPNKIIPNKGPRHVPAATFRATRVHYRYLLAKYGKSGLSGRQRVFPNMNKPSVHSDFSVINLLHEVEYAISQNKYSKETDKIVKNFKEELNQDLLFTESNNLGKSHKCAISNLKSNTVANKKVKLTKQSSKISFLQHMDSDDESNIHLINGDRSNNWLNNEISNITTGRRREWFTRNTLSINSSSDSDSNIKIFKSCSSEKPITYVTSKAKAKYENAELIKLFNKRQTINKDKKSIKKKKSLVRESKITSVTEPERLHTILQDLKKQLTISESHSPFLLSKDNSLTELNFAKEPSTYLNMCEINAVDCQQDPSELNYPQQSDNSQTELSQKEQPELTSLVKTNSVQVITGKKMKKQHSSEKSYTFRVDCNSIKNKPTKIVNIVTALEQVNKLLKNIPIQYDENTGQPYIVYDPKTIMKLINQVNTKHETKKKMKLYKKTKKEPTEKKVAPVMSNDSVLNATNVKKTSIEEESSLEVVGNQLLNCILKSMKTEQPTKQIFSQAQHLAVSMYSISDYYESKNPYIINEKNIINNQFRSHHPNPYNLCSNRAANIFLSPLIEKIIGYQKKCCFQVKEAKSNYLMTGLYYQAIIYMERQEYLVVDEAKNQCGGDTKENISFYCENKIISTCNTFNGHPAISYKDFNCSFGKIRNVPLDSIQKYEKDLLNMNRGEISGDSGAKNYDNFNRTKKYMVLGKDFQRKHKNKQNELALKYANPHDINYKSNRNNCDVDQLSLKSEYNACDEDVWHYKPVNKKQDICQTVKRSHLLKSWNVVQTKNPVLEESSEKHNYLKAMEKLSQKCLKVEAKEKDKLSLYKSNASILSDGLTNTKKPFDNNLLKPTNNNMECLRNFKYHPSFIGDILRSASINTISNTHPMKYDGIRNDLYF